MMLTYYFLKQSSKIFKHITRNISLTTLVYQESCDFIQQLFLDSVREYEKRRGGKILYEASPEIAEKHKFALKNLQQGFGVKEGEDMTKFPEIKFVDPVIEHINIENKD